MRILCSCIASIVSRRNRRPFVSCHSQASVLVADHKLLRHDFHRQLGGMSDAQIDAWLLENAAFLSAGQARRLQAGGDHHSLLGIDALRGGVDEVHTQS